MFINYYLRNKIYNSHSIVETRVLHVTTTYFFKFSDINYRRLDRSIDLYWLKLRSTSHDVVGTYLNKEIFSGVKLQMKLSSSDSPFNILFVDYRVLNPLFFHKTKDILFFCV